MNLILGVKTMADKIIEKIEDIDTTLNPVTAEGLEMLGNVREQPVVLRRFSRAIFMIGEMLKRKEGRFEKKTAFNKDFGTITGSVADGGEVEENKNKIYDNSNRLRALEGETVLLSRALSFYEDIGKLSESIDNFNALVVYVGDYSVDWCSVYIPKELYYTKISALLSDTNGGAKNVAHLETTVFEFPTTTTVKVIAGYTSDVSTGVTAKTDNKTYAGIFKVVGLNRVKEEAK